jgi:hypothetical protein
MAIDLYLIPVLQTTLEDRYNRREHIDLALPSQCLRNG